ncbi:efflux transporter outer membrane subunit [Paludibacterium purpuratum]|uniref:NodT family efflux transporter outer membrane factor (OMF) lipoprotein n=1 Tax=Paludibacterium purpuratum TaxID=1144873 RepID=A0A4R7B4S7_9NEIS|nr:efflux transporter outer membrane subunit [Paludibacterium purpuratum]TDR77853.1 NodT family efflux transporter outer membrane factor (OMF) lipoprotein [Paludibacterium purpuratum]
MGATHSLDPRGRQRLLATLLLAGLFGLGGCAQIPNLGALPTIKPIQQLGSAQSFAAPAAAWPGDGWWHAYGDAQLNALIDESLSTSPTLRMAEARFHTASAMVQYAGATRMPEVSGNVALDGAKQSYNYLMPRQALPQGWHDYGLASLNMSWELDFWGKNHAALAAAVSEQQADQAEIAQARLLLSTSVAAAYAELAHLYHVRDTDAEALTLRTRTVSLFRQRYRSALETLASVRQVEARQAEAEANLHVTDERIALQKNAIAALLGAGPDRALTIVRPTARIAAATGLPSNLALDLLGRRPDIVAARWRTEAAARRIDQAKAGFYPSVNLVGLLGVQSLGLNNLSKSGSDIGDAGVAISLPIFNTERLQGQLRGTHAEYEMAVANYDATLTNALHEVADVATSRKALDAELAATRTAVAAAQSAYDIVNQRYQGELATYLDVLMAEDALVSAKRSLADVEARALTLDVELVRALGGGFQNGTAVNSAAK